MGFLSSLRTPHYRVLAVLWTAVILIACIIPAETLPDAEPMMGPDKIVHGVLFAGFGVLWMRGLCPPDDGSLRICFLRRGAVLFLAGCSFALVTEWYQHVAPIRRHGDPYDAASNVLGLLLALGVYYVYHEHISGRTTAG